MGVSVPSASFLPKYVQLENALYEQISSGELAPGAQIPSESELSAQYDCARMTVRKALDGLVNRGILVRLPGKGTFVTDTMLTHRLSTTMSFSHALRARGYEITTQVLKQAVVPASPTVTRELKLPPGGEAVLVRRLRFVQGRPSAIHTSYLDARMYAGLVEVDLEHGSLLAAIEHIAGSRVLSYSVDYVRPSLLNAEESELLHLPVGSPILELEGTSFTEHGHPVHFNRATYPGDIFRLAVVNTHTQASSLRISDLWMQHATGQE
jgi:GntR family transcriptional regulator